MKTGESVKFKIILIILIILTLSLGCYSYRRSAIQNSITFKVTKDRKVEFGSANYSALDMLDKVSGDVSILKDVNINKIGEQVVLLQVTKDNVSKNVPVVVEVVDSVKPEIALNRDIVFINSGRKHDVSSNIKSVTDNVDGELKYKDNNSISDDDANYYTINGSVNTNSIGAYNIEVIAVDKAGNKTSKNFKVVVTSHSKETNLKSIAYSLIGKPYVSGANGPNAFDCSGFVQYVYKRVGLSVGRSATDQLYNGYEVSYSDIRVGDIIVWGYDKNNVTHTAIYVGDGLMIHAANPNEGVKVDKVSGWGNYTYVHVISVRRLP